MKLIESCWAPLFWPGFIGVLLMMVANVALMWLVALLGLAIAAAFPIERIIPYEPSWNSNHGDTSRDWLHALVNARMRLGPLRWAWAVAPLHRFHHNNAPDESDVNFGLFTTVWDRFLGTAVDDPEWRFAPGEFGLSNNETYPKNWWAQMQAPFRSSPRLENSS